MMVYEPAAELRRALDALRESKASGEITETDAEAIEELAAHERTKVEECKLKTYTVRNHVRNLRLWAIRCDAGLVDATEDDIAACLSSMRTGGHPDVKDEGINVGNYQTALRVFYRLHEATAIDPDDHNSEGDTLKIEPHDGRQLEPDDLLYEPEIDALLSACAEASPREAMFVAVGLATGQRIDALRTLRLKHVIERGPTMEITLNTEEGALKGARGSKPLLWAKYWAKPWLDNHPYKDNPDAAVFCPLPDSNRAGGEPEPITGQTLRINLGRRASEAGIEKDMYPHLLRHTAITRMVQEGLSEQQIKQLVGWARERGRFQKYVTLADEVNNDAVRTSLDLPTSGDAVVIGKPSLQKCGTCGEEYPPDRGHCPLCISTHRMTVTPEPTVEKIVEAIRAIDPEEKDQVRDILEK